jgi:hypothetical protein
MAAPQGMSIPVACQIVTSVTALDLTTLSRDVPRRPVMSASAAALVLRTRAHASVRFPRRAGGGAPHPPFAPRANRSAARAGARAFRGVNGPLPTRDALRFSRAGPLHLLHGALAPALVRGAIGVARRKADAGQESLPRRLQRRGMNSHERLPRNWSRGWASQERSHMREADSMGGCRARQFLRTVVVRDETGSLPRSGVPP